VAPLLIETASIGAGRDELSDELAGRDCVLIAMRDAGTGMSPEVVERAFSRRYFAPATQTFSGSKVKPAATRRSESRSGRTI
jgi:hypothetical protein